MKSIFTALFFLSVIACKAQDTTAKATFTKMEIEAEYPGGVPAWKQYLNKNLHYPDDAVKKEISGDVIVQFRIDSSGNTSDFKAISGPKKGGLREEAIRVVKASGKWIPAVQNDKSVASYRKEVISFKMIK